MQSQTTTAPSTLLCSGSWPSVPDRRPSSQRREPRGRSHALLVALREADRTSDRRELNSISVVIRRRSSGSAVLARNREGVTPAGTLPPNLPPKRFADDRSGTVVPPVKRWYCSIVRDRDPQGLQRPDLAQGCGRGFERLITGIRATQTNRNGVVLMSRVSRLQRRGRTDTLRLRPFEENGAPSLRPVRSS
jgi:hypothetical protein